MRALLLAAGFGSRLRPITDHTPKCLVPVQGVPLLGYWLELLGKAGVGPLLVNLHYLPEQVERFVTGSPYRERVTLVREENLLGTAGTLHANRTFCAGEPVMLVHADNLSRFEVAAFLERHRTRPAGCQITMMTFVSPTPESCGIVECDADGVVLRFHEKVANPPGNLANGAVYILEPGVLDFIAKTGAADFSTEVLPHYLGRICTFHNDDYHRDIGTPESYQSALREFPAGPAAGATCQ
jgi:mannose-1-phosphate guanylyltransferase